MRNLFKIRTNAGKDIIINLDFISSIELSGNQIYLTMCNGNAWFIASTKCKNELSEKLEITFEEIQ